jgi:hypothetical protein
MKVTITTQNAVALGKAAKQPPQEQKGDKKCRK